MKLLLTNPISDMERDMLEKYNIKEVTLMGFSMPRRYARVKDDSGAIWHCHPESFTLPEGQEPTLNPKCLYKDNHKPGQFCANCEGWG